MAASPADFAHRFVPAEGPPSGYTLLLLHGTGGNEDDLLPLAAAVAPGAAVLSPRGKVLENGMPRFFRRFVDGTFDRDDLERRTHELADWLEVAATAYALEERPLVAVGFSNGANLGASLLLLRPERTAAALLLRATVPFEPARPPALEGRPVFIAAGRRDPFVPEADTERLAALLRGCGAEVTLRWSNEGHALSPEEIVAARAWLAARTLR